MYKIYEAIKRKLQAIGLTPAQYEAVIRIVADALRI